MYYAEITDFLEKKCEEIRSLCAAYVRNMSDTGSRNIIYSLMEQKKAHIAELAEWVSDRDLSQVYFPDAEMQGYLEGMGDYSGFDQDMSILDFLSFAETRLRYFYELYAFLAGLAPNNDAAYLFQRLEEEDRKVAALLCSRRDLLALSS